MSLQADGLPHAQAVGPHAHRAHAAFPGAGRVVGDPCEHVQRLAGHRPQGEQVEVGCEAGHGTVVYATTEPSEALLLGGHTAVVSPGPKEAHMPSRATA